MSILRKIAGKILLFPIYFYRWFISPFTRPACRHTPTCSAYAIDAIEQHGPIKGLIMGTGRILRCRPGGTHGYDPVPKFLIRKYKPWNTWFGIWQRSNRLKQ